MLSSYINTAFKLQRTLWHELGHICSHYFNRELEDEAYRHTIFEMDTPLRSGGAVWMEFIADAIANYVDGSKPDMRIVPWSLQDRLITMAQSAFAERRPFPYCLGQYFAYLLTDSTVAAMIEYYSHDDERPGIGIDELPVDVYNATCLLSQMLDEHLSENGYFGEDHFYGESALPFWKISRPWLEKLGDLFDNLYDICCEEL